MGHSSQFVLVNFFVNRNGNTSQISLQNKTKHKNLIGSIHTKIKKVYFELSLLETNLLTLTDDTSKTNDIMDGVLFKNDFFLRVYDFPRVWNIADRKRKNNLIVLDDIKTFRNFNEKATLVCPFEWKNQSKHQTQEQIFPQCA